MNCCCESRYHVPSTNIASRHLLSISIPHFYSCVTFFSPIIYHQLQSPLHQPKRSPLYQATTFSTPRSFNQQSLLHYRQEASTSTNNGIQTNPIPHLLPHTPQPHPRRPSLRPQHLYSTTTRTRQLCASTTYFPHCSCFCAVLCVSGFAPSLAPHIGC